MTETFRKELVQRIVRNLLDIQILRLIHTEPMWGYRIKKQVAERFDVKLRHGALYPLLNTLERNGFVISQQQQQGQRIRKVYAITEKGNEYLETYRNMLKEQMRDEDIRSQTRPLPESANASKKGKDCTETYKGILKEQIRNQDIS